MRKYRKTLGFIVLCAFFMVFIEHLQYLYQPGQANNTLEDYFVSATFDAVELFKKPAFVFVIDNLVVLVVYLLFFGNLLAKELEDAGVYRLIREKNRKNWYDCEMGKVLFFTVLYTVVYLLVLYGFCYYQSGGELSGREPRVLLWMILGTAQLLVFCTIVTNVLEVVFGQAFGFLGGMVFLGILVQLCLYQREIPLFVQVEWLRYVNPAYGMALYENGSAAVIIFCSLLYLLEDVLVLTIGRKIICRIDIYGHRREVDG